MTTQRANDEVTSRVRVWGSLVAGSVAGIIVCLLGQAKFAPLISWDVSAAVFCTWLWTTIARFTAEQTEQRAEKEDPGRRQADFLLIGASLASLVAVGFLLEESGRTKGWVEGAYVGLAILSVVLSWCVVHTRFTLHYAHLYYYGENGGVDFSGGSDESQAPSYLDFAYLAFTIGMTFQVSDTSLQTRAFRVAALQHALLSYLFGTVIFATTINLIAGLSK